MMMGDSVTPFRFRETLFYGFSRNDFDFGKRQLVLFKKRLGRSHFLRSILKAGCD